MEEKYQKLDFRPLNKVDEEYFELALDYWYDTEVVPFLEGMPDINVNIEEIEFKHFKEWLVLLGSPNKELDLMDPNKMVSFSFAMTAFHEKPLTLAVLDQKLRTEFAMVYFAELSMFKDSMELLTQIISRPRT